MCRHALTLVELVVVIMILGVLAGMAAPRLLGVTDDAGIQATIADLQTIVMAAELCFYETGVWAANQDGEVLPPELEPYLRGNVFEKPCPIGGTYDGDGDNQGFNASVKITRGDPDLEALLEIDRRIDDGDLATGAFTRTEGPARLVIAE